MNFLDVAIIGEDRVDFAGHELTIGPSRIRTPQRGKAVVAIRPEAVEIAHPLREDRHPISANALDARVEWIEFLGGKCLLTLAPSSCRSQKISAEVQARTVHDFKLSAGSRISMILPPDAFNVYPA
jgi:hypothetical protein